MAYFGQSQSQGPWGQSQGPWGQSQSLVPFQPMGPMIPHQNYYPNGIQNGINPAWNNYYNSFPQDNRQPTHINQLKGNAIVNYGTLNNYPKND